MRRCPNCRQPVNWDESKFVPFCSERCQMIDLGRWANEEYRVPLAETSDGLVTDFDRESLEMGELDDYDETVSLR